MNTEKSINEAECNAVLPHVMPCFFALAINELKNILQKSVFLFDFYLVVNTEYCIFVLYKTR